MEKDTRKRLIMHAIIFVFVAILWFFLLAVCLNIVRVNEIQTEGFKGIVVETKTTIERHKKLFIVLYIVPLLAFVGFLVYLNFKQFFKRLFDKDDKIYWYWNEKTKNGVSQHEINKKFLVSPNTKNNQNNANWVIKFNKKLNKWWVNESSSDINSIVIGGVGSGKTQRVLLPNIIYNSHLRYKARTNFLVTDPKKEIIKYVGKKLERNGYKIYAVDFSDVKNSVGWNPLHYAYKLAHKTPYSREDLMNNINNAISEINNVVEQLPWSGENNMWEKNAKAMITTIIKFMLLVSLEKPSVVLEEDFNLINVSSMLTLDAWTPNQDWYAIAKWKAEIEKDYHFTEVFKDIRAFSSTVSETLTGIISNAQSVLSVFTQDEFIKTIVRKTKSFDLEEITNQENPYAIFIHYPDHKPANHFLISMLIDQIYQALITKASNEEKLKLKRKFLFMLDEAGNLPPIINLDNKVSISRSRNIFFQMIYQDYNQLKKCNTRANPSADKVIRNNLQFSYFLNSIDESTLKELSESLGKKVVIEKSTSRSSGSKQTSSNSVSESKREKPLMDVAEIKAKDKDYAIIQKIGYKPFFIKMRMAWQHFENDGYEYQCDELKKVETPLWDYQEVFLKKRKSLSKENPKEKVPEPEDKENPKDWSLKKITKTKTYNKTKLKELTNVLATIQGFQSKITNWKTTIEMFKSISSKIKTDDDTYLNNYIFSEFDKNVKICFDEFESVISDEELNNQTQK